MPGDERVRFCGSCKKHVYNLSSLEADLAERLLAETNNKVCVTYYQRRDGTVLHGDCPTGQRDKRRRSLVVAVGASVVAALHAACGASATDPIHDGGVQADAGAGEIALTNGVGSVTRPVFPKPIRQPIHLNQGATNDPAAPLVTDDAPCTGQELPDQPVLVRGEPAPVRLPADSDPAPKVRPLMGKIVVPRAMTMGGLAAHPDE